MTSMRLRIFLVLILMTSLVWGGSVVWVHLQTRVEVQRVLDRRLMESAGMVSSLIGEGQVVPVIRPPVPASGLSEARKLSCQIWTLNGDLVAKSNSAPTQMLAASEEGFSQRTINGETWRVYTVQVARTPYWVMVGDSLAVRDGLVSSVVRGLLLPALLGLVVLSLLIWGALDAGLYPVRRMADALVGRDPKTLLPLELPANASELHPVVHAVNDLMGRVMAARQRETEFTSAAAHELRTPLAGIRIQAQIAASTSDTQARANALKMIQSSVDRTARLVTNLLTLAREDDASPLNEEDRRWLTLGELLPPLNTDNRLQILGSERKLHVEPARIELVLGNLMTNAVTHAKQTIRIAIEGQSNTAVLIVEDDGVGVSQDELSKLGQRFYRPASSRSEGSGLGLSIARSAVNAHGGELRFKTSTLGGLRVEISGLTIS